MLKRLFCVFVFNYEHYRLLVPHHGRYSFVSLLLPVSWFVLFPLALTIGWQAGGALVL